MFGEVVSGWVLLHLKCQPYFFFLMSQVGSVMLIQLSIKDLGPPSYSLRLRHLTCPELFDNLIMIEGTYSPSWYSLNHLQL